MNKSGFAILSFIIFNFIISVSCLIFYYQYNTLKLFQLENLRNESKTCESSGDFSICRSPVNVTNPWKAYDYNSLFYEANICQGICNFSDLKIVKNSSYLGSLVVDNLENLVPSTVSVSAHINIDNARIMAPMTIISFGNISIGSLNCNTNSSIYLYSRLGKVTIAQHNCNLAVLDHDISSGTPAFEPTELTKVIERITY